MVRYVLHTEDFFQVAREEFGGGHLLYFYGKNPVEFTLHKGVLISLVVTGPKHLEERLNELNPEIMKSLRQEGYTANQLYHALTRARIAELDEEAIDI